MKSQEKSQVFHKIASAVLALLMIIYFVPEGFSLYGRGEASGIYKFEVEIFSDGTEPFDAEAEATATKGMDHDANNGIVRTFDSIFYIATIQIDQTGAVSEEITPSVGEENDEFTTTITIPEAQREYVEWNEEYLKNVGFKSYSIADDGSKTLTIVQEKGIGTGDKTFMVKLDVLSAHDGSEIQPKFTCNLNGKTDSETRYPSVVKVSSIPKFNLVLSPCNQDFVSSVTLNDDRYWVYPFAVTVQMHNDKPGASNLRGLEYPKGEISYKITSKVSDGSNQVISSVKPILLDYGYNNGKGLTPLDSPNYNDYLPKDNLSSSWHTPSAFGGGDGAVYNSGNLAVDNIVKADGQVSFDVKIDSYQFNGSFPTKNMGGSPYAGNVGCFSVGAFYIAVNENDFNGIIGGVVISAEDSEMKVNTGYQSETGEDIIVSNQTIKTDDQRSIAYDLSANGLGSLGKKILIHSPNPDKDPVSLSVTQPSDLVNDVPGDSVAVPGQLIRVWYDWYQTGFDWNLKDTKAADFANVFCFFDPDYLSPAVPNSYAETHPGVIGDLSIPFYGATNSACYYLTFKQEGKTGWDVSNKLDEMQKHPDYDAFNYYSTYEDYINSGETCVGFLIKQKLNQTQKGEHGITGKEIGCALKVKGGSEGQANIGKTTYFCMTADLWNIESGAGNVGLTLSPEEDNIPKGLGTEGGPFYTLTNIFSDGSILLKYSPAQYYQEGLNFIKHNHHSYGNTLLIVGAESLIKRAIVDTNGEVTDKVAYNLGRGETVVHWKLMPSVACSSSEWAKDEFDTLTTVTVAENIPEGLTYSDGSYKVGSYVNGEFVPYTGEYSFTQNGQQLIWTFPNYNIKGKQSNLLPEIFYDAKIDLNLHNGDQLNSTALVNADVDKRNANSRVAEQTITVIKDVSNLLIKDVVTPKVPMNTEIKYQLTFESFETAQDMVRIVDILPFNNDGADNSNRKTKYSGDYTISKIEVNRVTNGNARIYYSDSFNAQTNEAVNALDITKWAQYTSSNEPEATAFGIIIDSVGAGEKITIDVTLKPTGNKPGDVYYNDAYLTLKTEKGDDETFTTTHTNAVFAEVYAPSLSGRIWEDKNNDGLQDSGENGVSGVTVHLIDKATGNEVDSVQTDANGNYKFINIAAGEYEVRADVDFDKYNLTAANQGDDTKDSDAVAENGKAVIKEITVKDKDVEHMDVGLVEKTPSGGGDGDTSTSTTTSTPKVTTTVTTTSITTTVTTEDTTVTEDTTTVTVTSDTETSLTTNGEGNPGTGNAPVAMASVPVALLAAAGAVLFMRKKKSR